MKKMMMMKKITWTILILGFWVLVSPWLLGFYSFDPAMWNNLIVGILIVALSLWELFEVKLDSDSNSTMQ